MSEKSLSMASSPLTEMCIAICQPASDHFFKRLSQAACICSLCEQNCWSHGAGSDMFGGQNGITLLGHLEISQFLFCHSSLHFNTNL